MKSWETMLQDTKIEMTFSSWIFIRKRQKKTNIYCSKNYIEKDRYSDKLYRYKLRNRYINKDTCVCLYVCVCVYLKAKYTLSQN